MLSLPFPEHPLFQTAKDPEEQLSFLFWHSGGLKNRAGKEAKLRICIHDHQNVLPKGDIDDTVWSIIHKFPEVIWKWLWLLAEHHPEVDVVGSNGTQPVHDERVSKVQS